MSIIRENRYHSLSLANAKKYLSEIYESNEFLKSLDYSYLPYILILIDPNEIHELEFKNYCIFYFENASYSFICSIHNAISIAYVSKIVEYSNSDKYQTNSLIRIDNNRFVITIPYDFYQNISLQTLKAFKEILKNGYFKEIYTLNIDLKKQLLQLINSLSGIDKNIIIGYDQYFKELLLEV